MIQKPEVLISEIQDRFDELRMLVFGLKNCTNCDNWDQPKAICGKYKMLPPPHVIVVGCEVFIQDVPF